ncbi:AraC family transcriptional regulator [Nocardia goodfellowii]|uniref:AraC-like DNA-binding protein n=1 Tax=Nocardia goodfellowii TaxID=882446 RepID=A0ABS4QNT4_9NOCA|nr:AraC family transcriptional regulator [Nocardia goodfellowii]MBP2193371.1 AraC-like DNA-binding protein [Nocardia goodfellowii]
MGPTADAAASGRGNALIGMRAPTSALLVTRLAAEHGLAESDCLHGTGLLGADLRKPGTLVTGAQEITIITNVLRALPDSPGLGLAAGLRYHATVHGMWGYALIASQSIRDAIDIGLRFLDLSYSFCEITAEESADEIALVIRPVVPDPLVARFVAERDINVIATLLRDIAGPAQRLSAVRLPYPRPGPEAVRRIEDALSFAPQYDCDHYATVFDKSVIDDPLPQADPYTAELATQQCRELAAQRRALTGTAGRVRDLLFGHARGPLTEAEVAAALHLSGRTLRRQLAAEGHSYRSLLDEVRHTLACELLTGTDLPTAAIADRLGYGEAASFTRAFQRWSGTTPLRWRRAQ